MRILAVDTSSQRGSVCVVEDGQVLGEVRLATSVQHSERLFRSVEFLFSYLPFALEDVDLFVAARGPGSFTGLRLGLAAMEGFSAALGKPGAGVSTLDALAWKAGEQDGLIAPVIDARRGEVYGAVYRRTAGEVVEVLPPSAAKPAAWLESLPNETIRFCGDGAQRYREFINRPGWSIGDTDLYLAGTIAQLAAMGKCGPLEPIYVRKTDAEIAREGRHESVASPNPKGQ